VIQKELNIYSVNGRINYYREELFIYMNRMDNDRLLQLAVHYKTEGTSRPYRRQ
jgi:hypothetical protein